MTSSGTVFVKRLKKLRAQREISQRELAKRSGVSYSYLSRIEIGMQSPTIDIVEKLAAGLKVAPAALLGGRKR